MTGRIPELYFILRNHRLRGIVSPERDPRSLIPTLEHCLIKNHGDNKYRSAARSVLMIIRFLFRVSSRTPGKPSRWTRTMTSTLCRQISKHPAILDPAVAVEEETLTNYKAERYYPLLLGQTLADHYKTIGKLGYGSASTVWLCRDLRAANSYVAVKIYVNDSKVHRELPIYKHLNSLQLEHGGRSHVRRFLDHFDLQGPHGRHTCLVFEPLGNTLADLRQLCADGRFGLDLLRQTMRYVLAGLSFLHEAGVIHTGPLRVHRRVSR